VRLDLVVQPAQPAAQLAAHLGVERAERLVEEQHLGLDRERAGERDALALAAGKLVRIAVGEPVELHQLQQRMDLVANGGLRGTLRTRAHAQAERHVLEDRHVAEERVVLEHEAHRAFLYALVGGVLAVEEDAAAVGDLESRDHAQQRGLARARGAEERHQLARLDVERDAVEGLERAEALGDVDHLDAHRRSSTQVLRASVTSARIASSEAHANAAANWYSL
jgi:hypothetical protein